MSEIGTETMRWMLPPCDDPGSPPPPPERPRPAAGSPPSLRLGAGPAFRALRIPYGVALFDELLLVFVGQSLPMERELGRRALRSVGEDPVHVIVLAANERERSVGQHRRCVFGRHGLPDGRDDTLSVLRRLAA